MERSYRLGIVIFLTTIFIILFGWYIKYNNISETKIDSKEYITFDTAQKVLSKTPNPDKRYFYTETYIIKKRRTAIPFIYDKDTVYSQGKTYYSEER